MKKKNTQNEPAVAPLPEGDISAATPTSKPSQSRKKNASRAPTTKSKRDAKLAKFIIEKFVSEELIVWSRDMTMALKLSDKFPKWDFWRQLPVKNMVPSTAILWHETSRARLARLYTEYEKKVESHSKIVIEASETFKIFEEKFGEDYLASGVKKHKNVVEFLR